MFLLSMTCFYPIHLFVNLNDLFTRFCEFEWLFPHDSFIFMRFFFSHDSFHPQTWFFSQVSYILRLVFTRFIYFCIYFVIWRLYFGMWFFHTIPLFESRDSLTPYHRICFFLFDSFLHDLFGHGHELIFCNMICFHLIYLFSVLFVTWLFPRDFFLHDSFIFIWFFTTWIIDPVLPDSFPSRHDSFLLFLVFTRFIYFHM